MTLILGLLLVVVALTFLISSRAGAPWMPTSRAVRKQMLELLDLKAGETLIDLGSGDGGLLIQAANLYGVRAIGYEVNPLLVLYTRLLIFFLGKHEQVEVHNGNIFKIKLPYANAVFLFLMPRANERLRREIIPQLAPGTRIVSYAFGFSDLVPQKQTADSWGKPIFLYQI